MSEQPTTAAGGITTPDTCPTCGHEVVVHSDPVEGTSFYEPVEAVAPWRESLRKQIVAIPGGETLDGETWVYLDSVLDLLAATPAPREAAAPLDVERLARALHESQAVCWRPLSHCRYDLHGLHRDWADRIAAEYARLAAEEER
jgi:hypothetical protein